jgi:benzodiazapine receptor
MIALLLAALVVAVLQVSCALFVYVHAFRRSVGTGIIVLCIPFYIFYYAFSQFEHTRKNLIVSGLCATTLLTVVLFAALKLGAPLPPPAAS